MDTFVDFTNVEPLPPRSQGDLVSEQSYSRFKQQTGLPLNSVPGLSQVFNRTEEEQYRARRAAEEELLESKKRSEEVSAQISVLTKEKPLPGAKARAKKMTRAELIAESMDIATQPLYHIPPPPDLDSVGDTWSFPHHTQHSPVTTELPQQRHRRSSHLTVPNIRLTLNDQAPDREGLAAPHYPFTTGIYDAAPSPDDLNVAVPQCRFIQDEEAAQWIGWESPQPGECELRNSRSPFRQCNSCS